MSQPEFGHHWRSPRRALESAVKVLNETSIAQTEPDASRHAILKNEAELLLQWCTGWSRTALLLHLAEPPGDAVLTEAAAKQFQEAVRLRAGGTPLQYLMSEAGFYGRQFRVRPGCLIPRPETEWLVEAALKWLKGIQAEVRKGQTAGTARGNCWRPVVLDIGTGSGAIALTLKLEFPQAVVHAVDLSADALAIARENGENLAADVTWHHKDGIKLLASGQLALTVLVSNPPYIPSAEVAELAGEVRDHEPRLALDGGFDGLAVYRRIVEAGDRSFAGGPVALFLEVGSGQAPVVQALFEHSGAWSRWNFRRLSDLRGIERIVMGERN